MTEHNDHFKRAADGTAYAGDHLLLEFWGAVNLSDPEHIQLALESSARDAGATLLHSHYHHFGDGGGVSGVSILAESHITIHTWPERAYAAIDIFMCGECDPRDCVKALKDAFKPSQTQKRNIERGVTRKGSVKEVA